MLETILGWLLHRRNPMVLRPGWLHDACLASCLPRTGPSVAHEMLFPKSYRQGYVEAEVERIASGLEAAGIQVSSQQATQGEPLGHTSSHSSQPLVASDHAGVGGSAQQGSSTSTSRSSGGASSSGQATSLLAGWPRYWRPLAVGTSLMLYQQVRLDMHSL